jgi:hypothetical protein
MKKIIASVVIVAAIAAGGYFGYDYFVNQKPKENLSLSTFGFIEPFYQSNPLYTVDYEKVENSNGSISLKDLKVAYTDKFNQLMELIGDDSANNTGYPLLDTLLSSYIMQLTADEVIFHTDGSIESINYIYSYDFDGESLVYGSPESIISYEKDGGVFSKISYGFNGLTLEGSLIDQGVAMLKILEAGLATKTPEFEGITDRTLTNIRGTSMDLDYGFDKAADNQLSVSTDINIPNMFGLSLAISGDDINYGSYVAINELVEGVAYAVRDNLQTGISIITDNIDKLGDDPELEKSIMNDPRTQQLITAFTPITEKAQADQQLIEQFFVNAKLVEGSITLTNNGIIEDVIKIASSLNGVSEDETYAMIIENIDDASKSASQEDEVLGLAIAGYNAKVKEFIKGERASLTLTIGQKGEVPLPDGELKEALVNNKSLFISLK